MDAAGTILTVLLLLLLIFPLGTDSLAVTRSFFPFSFHTMQPHVYFEKLSFSLVCVRRENAGIDPAVRLAVRRCYWMNQLIKWRPTTTTTTTLSFTKLSTA